MRKYSSQQALHALAAYCSKAERCTHDVKQKLTRWAIPEDEKKNVIKQLREGKFLDESRFCKAFVNDKIKYARWGIYKIKYELKKRSIPNDLINEAFSKIDSEEEKERLLQLLQAKKKSVKGKNEFEINQKLMRFAVSRGFSMDDIEIVISKLQV